jgi:hypothetical protein
LLRETGLRWYGDDSDCPAWGEPSGDDFQSSALIEAECMRRLLPPEVFLPWFDRFLPPLIERKPATLFRPTTVTDRTDGKIAHLDGLNLSRAWCWRSLGNALPANDDRRALVLETAENHLTVGLPILPATTWASIGLRASPFSHSVMRIKRSKPLSVQDRHRLPIGQGARVGES